MNFASDDKEVAAADVKEPVASAPSMPRAAAARLSLYLRELRRLQRESVTRTNSRSLGAALGVTDAVIVVI